MNFAFILTRFAVSVSLFTREWIEIDMGKEHLPQRQGLPLYEGVD